MLGRLAGDLRFALRQMARAPGFASIAILTLALGIGANTAIYSVVDALLLRALPFAAEDRLVSPESLPLTLEGFPEGPGDAYPFADELPSFERLAAWTRPSGVNLLLGTEPERVEASQVTFGFFATLGVNMALGRGFLESDDRRVVVLGPRLWRTRFGGDEDIVGSSVAINGQSVTVIGVAPPGFALPEGAEMWLPLSSAPDRIVEGSISASTVGLLREGVSIEQAAAELALFAERHLEGSWMQERVSHLRTLRQVMVGDSRTPLLILLGATGVILLIACANVANLFLTRAVGRRHELSVRASLGAGVGRLVRQLTTEALLVSVSGGALGILIAFWTLDAVVAAAPADFPLFADPRIDPRVLGFTLALSLGTGLLFGIWPALKGARIDLAVAMKASRRGGGSPSIRNGPLVVGQVALTLVLVVAGGLLIQSLARMRAVDPGFRPEHAITASISLPRADYPDPASRHAFLETAMTRIRTTPGVDAAGGVNFLPLSTALGFSSSIEIAGWVEDEQPREWVGYLTATAGYFDAIGQPIVEGRGFDARDHRDAPATVVVSRSLADRYWTEGSPLGERLRFSGDEEWYTVIGVAADVRTWGLAEAAPFQAYLSANHAAAFPGRIVARGPDPAVLAAAVRSAIGALDPTLPVFGVSSLEDVVGEQAAEQRFLAGLLTAFAVLALVLAAAGIYGVLAYRVASRRHEIGIRLTFGARAADILRLVLREGVGLALAGIALGVLGALASSRLLTGVLFEIRPTSPLTLAGAALFLFLVATAACLAPASRASRVDPAVAMRDD